MGKVFIISDLHLSHLNMAKKRGFETIEDHDNHIIDKWNSVVTSKDTVWILGDITMEKKGPFHLLDKMKGIKKVVLGNHDMPQHIPELLKHVNHVCSTFKKKNVIFTHIPIHPQELQFRFKKNIHGHLHENKVMHTNLKTGKPSEIFQDERFINVSCEILDFTPIELNTLLD